MTVPQRLTFVTLGTRDVPALRRFYTGWGWQERPGADETFVQYQVGSVRLALFSLTALRDEAAPDDPTPEPGRWNGITLAINVDSPEAVDETCRTAVAAGARAVAAPVKREWGGYSGYVADPEGNRWEIAWLPEFA